MSQFTVYFIVRYKIQYFYIITLIYERAVKRF